MRARAHRSPDERIRAEAVVEGAQVVVDAEREAHALQSLLGHVGAVGPGHEHHAIARGLADADDRGDALDVHEPLEAAVAPAAHHAVAPGPRQAIGPYRTHLSPDLDHRGATLRLAPDGRPNGRPWRWKVPNEGLKVCARAADEAQQGHARTRAPDTGECQ